MRTRRLYLFLSLVLLGFLALKCGSPTEHPTKRKTPGPPHIDSLKLTTWNDTLPCIKIFYTDTNSLTVTFNMYKAGPNNNSFLPFEKSLHIPGQYRVFSDFDLPESFAQYADKYKYEMLAVSSFDSISQTSNSASIYLLKAEPVINSVDTTGPHPAVHYQILGHQMGKDYYVQLIKNDSIISADSTYNNFTDPLIEIHTFNDIYMDSLRSAAGRDSTDNGIYGIRILVEVSPIWDQELNKDLSAYSIAVDNFRVK